MARFVDNVTPLNAETLGALDGLPIYSATYDPSDTTKYAYRITDENFLDALKNGYTFVMIPNTTSQVTNNSTKEIVIKYGTNTYYMLWNDPNGATTASGEHARQDRYKCLKAGMPYIIKCFTDESNGYVFVITEIFRDKAATENSFGGVKLRVEGNTLYITTN